jgi:hypothetical protein
MTTRRLNGTEPVIPATSSQAWGEGPARGQAAVAARLASPALRPDPNQCGSVIRRALRDRSVQQDPSKSTRLLSDWRHRSKGGCRQDRRYRRVGLSTEPGTRRRYLGRRRRPGWRQPRRPNWSPDRGDHRRLGRRHPAGELQRHALVHEHERIEPGGALGPGVQRCAARIQRRGVAATDQHGVALLQPRARRLRSRAVRDPPHARCFRLYRLW